MKARYNVTYYYTSTSTLKKDGRTALMTAAFLGHTAVAALLLKRGAKVDHVDKVISHSSVVDVDMIAKYWHMIGRDIVL